MGKWIFAILFGGVAALFIGIGIWLVLQQDAAIRNARPMDALIESSRVERHESYSKGRKRVSYSAAIKYSYRVGGQRFESTRIAPFASGPYSASKTVEMFPAGAQVKGWYDARDKSSAFLIKKHDFSPYLFILFPMIHLSIGVLVVGRGGKSKAPELIARSGTFELQPESSIDRKLKAAMGMTALWFSVSLAACGHFFSVAEKPWPTWTMIVAASYFAIGIIPLWIALHFWRLRANVSDAGISLDQYPIRRGYPTRVRLALPLIAGGRIETATITLQCQITQVSSSGGKRQISTSTAWERSQSFAEPQDVLSDRVITADLTFLAPPEQSPSTPSGQRGYPKIAWRFQLHVKRPGPDYKSNYRVEVA